MSKKPRHIKNSLKGEHIKLSDAQGNPDVLSDEQSMWDDRSEQNEANIERVEAIRAVMHKLTPNERRVIQLLGNGRTQEEVSDIMAISTGNVYNLLTRAQKKIKKLVG